MRCARQKISVASVISVFQNLFFLLLTVSPSHRLTVSVVKNNRADIDPAL